MDIEKKTVLNKGKTVDMEIRAFDSDKDFKSIKNWATDERTHSMWCANRFKYPLAKEDFTKALKCPMVMILRLRLLTVVLRLLLL